MDMPRVMHNISRHVMCDVPTTEFTSNGVLAGSIHSVVHVTIPCSFGTIPKHFVMSHCGWK